MSELSTFYQEAKTVARLAGDILKKSYLSCHDLSHQYECLEIETKEANDANLVTIVDRKIQDFILEYIKNKFPNHCFIGEESTERIELYDQPTWIIDPIDGTTNFVHGLPYCCVSIGFVVNKIPSIGVIYNPILGQMFTACIGQGAFLNDSRLGLNRKPIAPMSQSVFGCEYGNERTDDVLDPKLETLTKLIKTPVRAIRCFGSAAMNLCMTASGKLDAYFEAGIHCWDIAAGVVILREAGGVAGNYSSKSIESIDLMSRNIVAIRPGTSKNDMVQRFDEIQKLLSPIPYERD